MARVLVIGDTHAPCMLDGYVEFLQEMADVWNIDRVVHIGDLVDWASISYHPKAPSLKNSEEEFSEALAQVQRLSSAFPVADWLIGNHDSLTERQATDLGLPLQVLRSYTDLWQLPDWVVTPRFGTLEIDGVRYSHGETGRGGQAPAIAQAADTFQSTVIGHFHAAAGVTYRANENARYFGMNVGCGVDYHRAAMQYGVKYPKKPVLGCGVVIDGTTAIFEPMPLTNRMGIL
jgi:predicted phosphodiesterase